MPGYIGNESCFGIKTKFIQEEEMQYRKVFKKRLFASRDIKIGEMWERDMLYAMRAESGRDVGLYKTIVGTFTTKDYKQYETIS